VSHSAKFTTEQQLSNHSISAIEDFWQQGQFGEFNGVDNIRINFARFTNPANKRCLIISSGRSEAYLKYKELSFDFFQQGFNIFILDHRGQGLSQRMLANQQQGYVNNFDDYAEDLHYFISDIVNVNCQTELATTKNKLYLLAHSMGGAIALRYLQKHPNIIDAAVLSSPMIAFNNGGLPQWLSNAVITSGDKINHWFGNSPWYFFAQQDYQVDEFIDNPLTHSKIRFQRFLAIYQQVPKIQLGGVTIHWLQQAIKTTKAIFTDLNKLTTPILVIQSGADSVVDNNAQNEFCAQLHKLQPKSCANGQPIVVDEAKHELFFENDKYRQKALSNALNWFTQH
jgi:lysophospholipase